MVAERRLQQFHIHQGPRTRSRVPLQLGVIPERGGRARWANSSSVQEESRQRRKAWLSVEKNAVSVRTADLRQRDEQSLMRAQASDAEFRQAGPPCTRMTTRRNLTV